MRQLQQHILTEFENLLKNNEVLNATNVSFNATSSSNNLLVNHSYTASTLYEWSKN